MFRIPQEPDSESRSGTTQVTLSLVCSRWRAIALNTRTLWGDVMVYYDAGREQDRGLVASFQFIQNWLNRAGMTPISLFISIYEPLESTIAAISKTLLSSFHIKNLDLEFVQCRGDQILFPCLPEMPSLKELHLRLDLDDFVDTKNIYLIPWHQLRVFTLNESHWSSQMLFNILQRCKSLVECTLSVKLESMQRKNNIVLPNLESLQLGLDGEDSADLIIRSLTVPNLRSLDIRPWVRPWDEDTRLPLSSEAIVIMIQHLGLNKRLAHFSLSLTEQPVDVRLLLGSMLALKSILLLGPLMFRPGTFNDLSCGTIGPRLEEVCFDIMSDEEIGQLLDTVGQRHEKAKAVSDIRPFASVTCCTSGGNLESHKQRAQQCGEAFNSHIKIHTAYASESDSDLSI